MLLERGQSSSGRSEPPLLEALLACGISKHDSGVMLDIARPATFLDLNQSRCGRVV